MLKRVKSSKATPNATEGHASARIPRLSLSLMFGMFAFMCSTSPTLSAIGSPRYAATHELSKST